ncbi:helix-turn-helix domain-containing protein [Epidermidibacterium keratini]|uniref:Helix-turn-helix domain-containing protein n=1 Tax=Epidermidibacterium keratini TaxID=1891644 RepID=A0A7L4YK43_9ACTN|nr:helix-turn-helix domain-containing protein [Epidermidibacterium keratini]QHB99585.1 helix-turn-helix domain-containing protein [Epidermidibacterium keratini]
MTQPAKPHRVAVLGIAPVIGFDLVIAPQLFGIATGEDGAPLYEPAVVGIDRQPLQTPTGYQIVPQYDARWLATADTVIVPGTMVRGPRYGGVLPPELRAAFAQIRPGARIMSICTGAFVLGAAGLLDSRPATTHWAKAQAFRELYPKVRLDENVLFVDDGDILTSAGLGSGVDLCLHVIRRDHGAAVANSVARYCVVPPWREGGQAQFIDRAVPTSRAESTGPAREWALRNLDSEITVQRLATHAHMSARTFARRFRDETGQSPGAWLITQRVAHAQHLLESTDLPVEVVAAQSGLGTGASLRAHLRTHAGLSPAAYRRTFRGPVAPLVH